MLNNLSSDDLRRQLGENNAAMNTLAEDNQEIVELLSQRGLQAINYSSDLAEIRLLLERRADVPLTAKELKAGGWWCADTSSSAEVAFSLSGLAAHAPGWDGKKYYFCFMYRGFVGRDLMTQLPEKTLNLKQIHRRGNGFYWGAPNG